MANMILDDTFLNAYTYGFCEKKGFTRGTAWRWSLSELARTTGCNAIILPVCAWQDHTYSTQIDSLGPDVMDAADVRRVSEYARELGLKLILKAMVNCRDGYWRAYIRFFDQPVPVEPGWEDWFASWNEHVCRVADMAEENQADMLCIGCEMVGTDHREREWRGLVDMVRRRYHGPVTYNCDKYQEDRVAWWDAVDVISSSGYYPLGEMDANFERIRRASEAAGKPFMFMECGCPARKQSKYRPNDWTYGGECSQEEQAEWYEAFIRTLERFPFIRGVGWWDWPATRLYPAETGPDQDGYCTYGKRANEVLRQYSERNDSVR